MKKMALTISFALALGTTLIYADDPPVVSSLSPSSAVAGSPGFSLTVNGSSFTAGSIVLWNGAGRSTTFVSAEQLLADIPASDVSSPGAYSVSVVNPGIDNSTSNSVTFTVDPAAATPPSMSGMSPTTTVAGSPAFTLTVNGSDFNPDSVVLWNNAQRPTTFVSANQLNAAIPESDVAAAGVFPVAVLNPGPGNPMSAPQNFTVTSAASPPVLSSLNPSEVEAGSQDFTLILNGSNFSTDAVALWNGAPRTTTYMSPSQLAAAIPASDIQNEGSTSVSITNPTPTAETSQPLTFTISRKKPGPTPTLISMDPSTIKAGSGSFTLTVTGFGFESGANILWDGKERPTIAVSPTVLQATIRASDIDTAGLFPVTVENNKGGASNSLTFTVTPGDNPPANKPQISAVSPNSVTAGSGSFVLTVQGANFTGESRVQVNGGARSTDFISANELHATIRESDVRNPRQLAISVRNGDGSESNEVALNVRADDTPPPPGPVADIGLEQARVYPSPWAADKHAGLPITFDQLSPDSTVKIFTLSARWIKSLSAPNGSVTWDLTSDSGDRVTSGYYIYLIQDSAGHTAKGKLAVIK